MRTKLLMFLMFFTFTSFVKAQDLFINEFLASNDFCCADENGDFDDWIEIYNAGTEAVDVGGWFITDDLTAPSTWQIPATASDSTTIQPGGFLLLWADKEPEQGVLHVNIKLSGGGEQIGLFNADTSAVDTLTYTSQTTDISYGRLTDGADSWQFFNRPTPGRTNGVPQLVINEFLASNDANQTDENGQFDDWIEIYNAGSEAVDIGGMFITDDLTAPGTWQIPTTASDSTTIQPGGFLLLWADKESEQGILHVEIKLSGGGEQVGLYASDTTMIDTMTFGAQAADTSFGRNPDGVNIFAFFGVPSPGASNATGVIVSVEDDPAVVIKDFELHQNYPNPFNPSTTISFNLDRAEKVNITIFNIMGQKLATLLDEHRTAGRGVVNWDATGAPSGVYFYTIKTGSFTQTKKMLLLR